MGEIIQQFTVEQEGRRRTVFLIRVPAVNSFAARQKARAWARREVGLTPNLIDVEGDEKVDGKQLTFSEMFPDEWGVDYYDVRLTVDK